MIPAEKKRKASSSRRCIEGAQYIRKQPRFQTKYSLRIAFLESP
jgi:hypothetical protein